MTNVGATSRGSRPSGRAGSDRNAVARLFASIGLYISQILDELRKVVRPTRSELWNYTLVVIVFVLIVIGVVSVLDFGFSHLVAWAFG
ncbi:MAG: preprotein translocase subunit SecE [Nostocoides sp.]